MNKEEKDLIKDLIDESLLQISKRRIHFGATVSGTNGIRVPEDMDKKIRFVLENTGVRDVEGLIENTKGHALEEVFSRCIKLWKPSKPAKGKSSSRPNLIKLISIIGNTLPEVSSGKGSIDVGKFIESLEDLLELKGDVFLKSKLWRSISAIGSDFETSFRDALCDQLNKNSKESECEILNNLAWVVEKRFLTRKLPNKNYISVDIFGRDVRPNEETRISIELKYVTQSYNGPNKFSGEPSNFPGFHYDILKDCIKTEILLEKEEVDFGVVIGMTNHPAYWGETAYTAKGEVQAKDDDWARNCLKLIVEKEGMLKPGIIRMEPSSKGNLDNTVYCEKRFHISLSREWSYKWADYSNHGKLFGIGNSNDEYAKDDYKQKFRYISFIPSGEIAGYKHELDDISCIPFLEARTRERADKRKLELDEGKRRRRVLELEKSQK